MQFVLTTFGGQTRRPLPFGCGTFDRQRTGDVLEGLALGGNAEHDLDHTPDNHRPGTDEIPDEQLERVTSVADQVAVNSGPTAPKHGAIAKKIAMAWALTFSGKISLTVR